MRHNQGLSTCRESRRLLYSRSRLQDTYRMAYHARTPGGNPAWTSRLPFVAVAHPCEARIRSYDLRPILPGRRMCWRVGRGMGWGVGRGVARDRMPRLLMLLKGSLESSIAPRHMPAPFMSVTVYDVQWVCVQELRYRTRHLALVSSISPRLPVREIFSERDYGTFCLGLNSAGWLAGRDTIKGLRLTNIRVDLPGLLPPAIFRQDAIERQIDKMSESLYLYPPNPLGLKDE